MKNKKTILLSLPKQFLIIMVILALWTTGITIYSSYDYVKLQTLSLNDSLKSYSSRLAQSTTETYESFENICYSVAYSSGVQNYLQISDASKNYVLYQQLNSQLNSSSMINTNIIDIAVYGQNDKFVSLCSSSTTYKNFTDNLSDSRFSFRSAGIAIVNGVDCQILAMPIYSLDTGQSRYLGILFLAVDLNSIFSSQLHDNESNYDPKIILSDCDGNLIYGDRALFEETAKISSQENSLQVIDFAADSKQYSVISYTVPSIENTLYVLVDQSIITKKVALISLRFMLSMVGMILFLLLLLALLYRPLIRSLKQLTDFMHDVSEGDRRKMKQGPNIQQGLIGCTEVHDISTAFNDMLIKTDQLNRTIFDTYMKMYELEANNRKTEIAFLRSQVNPHFLYNTLAMICGLAAEGMNDKIITVTSALSQMFRYSIKGSDMATLQEEMEIVRNYLMIQKTRFEDRIMIRYEIQENIDDCLIPKMILQPLVENAIVHGLEQSLVPGELLVSAKKSEQDNHLVISIADTGVGISKDKLENIIQLLNHTTASGSGESDIVAMEANNKTPDNIGIINVNSRIVLYYGPEYTLHIDSDEGLGTKVEIRIPYRTQKHHDNM